MKIQKTKNNLINYWKKTFLKYSKLLKKTGMTDIEVKDNIKKQAQYQMESIERARPDKNKQAEQQMNEKQLEYWNWLKEVYESGKLE